MRHFPPLDKNVSPARLARRVDSLCDRFEAAWKKGRRPKLERYLAHVPPAAQPELLRELLMLELEYRPQTGQKPEVEEYHGRFPEHGELIDTVFREAIPETPSNPYLLRRWAANRLASQMQVLALPEEQQNLDQAGALSVMARILSRTAGGEKASRVIPDSSFDPDRQSEKTSDSFSPPTKLLQLGNGDPAAAEAETKLDNPRPAVRILGDYELLGELGKGGMGVVYRARQRSTRRTVALKVIRSDQLALLSAGEREEWYARFRREGQMAACLEHDHLVTVYEVGKIASEHYYSMRFVDGQSLAEILRKGPVANHRAALWLEQVARALHALHLRGIVHRDLKPRNILVDANDRPFLTDFGLAKWSEYAELTHAGACVGTPEYMAPEQARNSARVNAASDIYSVGATLYDILTGRPPFRAADPIETLRQVQDLDPPSPRRLNPAIHRDLELICLKCLEKEPHKRYGNALEVAEELRRYRCGEPLRHTRPVGRAERIWRWCRRKPALAAASSLAVAALLATTIVSVSFATVQSRHFQDQRLQFAELALDKGLTRCAEGEVDDGMLWFARSLERVPADAPNLDNVIRANFASWRRLLPVKAALPHTENLVAVAFSRDGETILTATPLKAHLWEAATGKPIGRPLAFQRSVEAAALSPDGTMILAGDAYDRAELWQVATGVGQPLLHNGQVTAVAFSPDGKMALTGSNDKTAKLWNTATAEPIGQPLLHKGPVLAVAFSPDGKTVLTGSMRWGYGTTPVVVASTVGFLGSPMPITACAVMPGTAAQIWDVATCLPRTQPLWHEENVFAVAFSPDGKAILTVSGNIVRIWDADTGQFLGKPFGRQIRVSDVAFSPDGNTVLTASNDKTAQLWELSSRSPVGLPLHHRDRITCLAFSPDGKTILTGSRDKLARLWEASPTDLHRSSFGAELRVLDLAFDPKGELLATGFDGGAQIWDVATGKPRSSPFHKGGWVRAVAFSPDGKTVLTGSTDNTAQIWDVKRERALAVLLHPNGVWAVSFSPDGKWALTGCQDGSAQLWDTRTGQRVGPPFWHRGTVFCVVFSLDGKTIVTGSEDCTAQIWSSQTGLPTGAAFRHGSSVRSVAVSSNGRFVLTGSSDETGQLWDTITGTRYGPPLQHQGPVMAVAISADSKLALTGSADKSARLWDLRTGAANGPPLKHRGMVRSVAFSRDGRLVLTGSDDKTAQLWDVATTKPWGHPLQHQEGVNKVAFSPDGKTVATGSSDKTAHLWDIPAPIEGTAERIVLWTKIVTGTQLDDAGVVNVLDMETWDHFRRRLEQLGGAPAP